MQTISKMLPLEQERPYQATSQTIMDLQTFQVMTIFVFFDVWQSIEELIDTGVNVKPKNCLTIIACILILLPTLLLV